MKEPKKLTTNAGEISFSKFIARIANPIEL